MAAYTVVQGDAFDLSETLQPGSVDLIVTSPPYWGLRTYGLDHNFEILAAWKATGASGEQPPPYAWYREQGGVLGLEPYPEWYIAHLTELFDRLQVALKPGGSAWVNLGDTYFARWSSIREGRQGLGETPERIRRRTPAGDFRQDKQLLLLPSRFAIAMQDRRWILRNDLIWSKPSVAPRPERDRLRLAHEHFFHFALRPTNGRASYYYDLDQVEPGATDVVSVPSSNGRSGHSATFPEQLIRPRIESSCPPGGIVLDPFCGIGTTLDVACATGRDAVGFELSEEYAGFAATKGHLVTCGDMRAA